MDSTSHSLYAPIPITPVVATRNYERAFHRPPPLAATPSHHDAHIVVVSLARSTGFLALVCTLRRIPQSFPQTSTTFAGVRGARVSGARRVSGRKPLGSHYPASYGLFAMQAEPLSYNPQVFLLFFPASVHAEPPHSRFFVLPSSMAAIPQPHRHHLLPPQLESQIGRASSHLVSCLPTQVSLTPPLHPVTLLTLLQTMQ